MQYPNRGITPMTLLDAPVYDAARYKRHRTILIIAVVALAVVIIGWWGVAGFPADFPWHWNAYIYGKADVNRFLDAVEQNDLTKAYGIWMNDTNWQQHPQKYRTYPFSRFQQDWSSTSPDNDYGVIKTHRIAASHVYGNVLLLAVLINGRKSGALNLAYDPKTHTINYSPPDMEINPEFYSK
jgi:hypothetical protein